MISLQLQHLLLNSQTPTIFIMNLNRKLLQQQDPSHPIIPPTLLRPINDSPPSSAATAATAEENSRRPFNPNTSPFDTSMALTILVLLTALFFMSFFSFYIRRVSGTADDHHNRRRGSSNSSSSSTTAAAAVHRGSRSKGLDPESIKSLPTFSYGGDAKHRIDCSICLSEFEEGETVKLISYCRHGFHPGCIDTWLASHLSCPLCRSTQIFGEVVGLGAGEDSVGDVVTMRSTAGDGIDEVVGPANVRRTCSFSSLIIIRDGLSLPRSNSF